VDRRATLFYPPAVSLTTLIFATVLAVVKSWGRIGAAGLQESNGDEFRRGFQSVSSHPINRT
jgi:hypothetical protein